MSVSQRGLDVGAIEYIHKRLIERGPQGKLFSLSTSELDEILNVSDRIAVIHDGKIQGIVIRKPISKGSILMAGGKIQKENQMSKSTG